MGVATTRVAIRMVNLLLPGPRDACAGGWSESRQFSGSPRGTTGYRELPDWNSNRSQCSDEDLPSDLAVSNISYERHTEFLCRKKTTTGCNS